MKDIPKVLQSLQQNKNILQITSMRWKESKVICILRWKVNARGPFWWRLLHTKIINRELCRTLETSRSIHRTNTSLALLNVANRTATYSATSRCLLLKRKQQGNSQEGRHSHSNGLFSLII